MYVGDTDLNRKWDATLALHICTEHCSEGLNKKSAIIADTSRKRGSWHQGPQFTRAVSTWQHDASAHICTYVCIHKLRNHGYVPTC